MSISLNGDGIISGVSSITVGAGASVFSPAANTLALGTNGSERVRVTSTGSVGIGTDTPATTNGFVGKLVTVYSSGNNVISGESTAGVGYGLILEGRYDGRSGNERYSQVNLKTDGSNNGQFTVSLAAAGGDVSERANFTINGLTFNGDTAAANALDDYEEGTWTPNLGGNTTYYNQTAAYTKIGNLVYIRGQVHVNSIGTGSATVISGLPFNASGGGDDTIPVNYFGDLNTNVYWFSFQTNNNTANLLNVAQTGLDGQTGSVSLFKNATQIVFSGCYRV